MLEFPQPFDSDIFYHGVKMLCLLTSGGLLRFSHGEPTFAQLVLGTT